MSFATKADQQRADKHAETLAAPFDVPNLDETSIEDLAALERVFDALAGWCSHARRGRNLRTYGDIQAAQACEAICERYCKRLPAWARW